MRSTATEWHHTDCFTCEAAGMIGAASEVYFNWEKPLFNAFREAVETTAIRRGSDRWGAGG